MIRHPARRILAALALVLGIGGTAEAQTTIRWGNNGEVTTMDPHGVFSTANAALLGNIYDSLVRLDRNLVFQPGLATAWVAVAPDHYRFTIRQGVRFHDGTPMTAADVVASIRRASVPNSPYASVTHMIREVQQSGPDTVDVLLRGPYPVLINDLAGISILSEAWMKAHDALLPTDPARGTAGYANVNTNGTGPFRLVSRQLDSETVLEAFPDWWDKREHNIDRISFRPVPNDATRLAGLLSGQLDVITPVPLQDAERLRQNPGITLVEAQDLRVMYFGFNVGAAHQTAAGAGPNPLADRRVRQAMTMALDVPAITRAIMRGLTQPTHALIAREITGYEPAQAVQRASYDPEGAKRLLAEAGYPDGFTIGLECPNDRFVNGDRLCQAAAAMWARVGVKVSYSGARYAAFIQRFLKQEPDMYLMGWANTPQLDGFSILNNVFHTRDQRSGSWNAGGYADPAFDALVDRTATEMDLGKRTSLLTEAFALERANFWAIPLYREPMLLASRKGFEVPAFADGRMRFWLARAP
ncbi:ABC transporter substrate-binding protein [Roseomonas indoligenes]|uniref:ABC transporter substrate-binding protein n=1 Tax=Roseomonas indoligenes TaxID=2820811 RepID=A0A940N4S6_9PROT|nr:ABC transporter substrate-binding protein [Pararoseomonas indoligenes]MBP0495155.1 ABC transporter substrate-binding protein [Pararoseomonas indoligenes]